MVVLRQPRVRCAYPGYRSDKSCAYRGYESGRVIGTPTVIPAKAGIQAVTHAASSPSFQRKLEPILIFAPRQPRVRFAYPGYKSVAILDVSARPDPHPKNPCGGRGAEARAFRPVRGARYPQPMSPAACPC